jgi:hypothetical protein
LVEFFERTVGFGVGLVAGAGIGPVEIFGGVPGSNLTRT